MMLESASSGEQLVSDAGRHNGLPRWQNRFHGYIPSE